MKYFEVSHNTLIFEQKLPCGILGSVKELLKALNSFS